MHSVMARRIQRVICQLIQFKNNSVRKQRGRLPLLEVLESRQLLTGPVPDALEPNEAIGSASDIGSLRAGYTIQGLTVHDRSDRDMFQIELERDGRVTDGLVVDGSLYNDGPGAPNRLFVLFRIDLLNQAGETLRSATSTFDSRNGTPANQRANFSLQGLSAGTYYLSMVTTNLLSTYSINISPVFQDPPVDALELNNTLSTATEVGELTDGYSVRDLTIHNNDDRDLFQFELPRSGTSADHVSASGTYYSDGTGAPNQLFVLFQMKLMNHGGETIRTVNSSFDNRTGSPTMQSGTVTLDGLVPGIYYLELASDSLLSQYDLSISPILMPVIEAPRATSFARQSPSVGTTDADQLVFRVIFSQPVSRVSAEDFQVIGTTATVASVSEVSGSGGRQFDVHVSGGDLASLNGTVGLIFAAGQDIIGLSGNGLVSTEPSTKETFTVANSVRPPESGVQAILVPSNVEAGASSPVSFNVRYQTQDDAGNPVSVPSAGLSVTTFFDSSKLTFQPPSDYFQQGKVADASVQDDIGNLDGNPATDKLFTVVWHTLSNDFPSTSQPIVLFTTHFTTASNFSGTTEIGVGGRPANNFTLKSSSLTVTGTAAPTVGTAPILANPGTPSAFIAKNRTGVAVFPTITVTDPDSPMSISQIIITASAISGKKKKPLDFINIPNVSSFGTRSDEKFEGVVFITIDVNPGVTNTQVQALLQSITFETTKKGAKSRSREIDVQVVDVTNLESNLITQTLPVSKKRGLGGKKHYK